MNSALVGVMPFIHPVRSWKLSDWARAMAASSLASAAVITAV